MGVGVYECVDASESECVSTHCVVSLEFVVGVWSTHCGLGSYGVEHTLCVCVCGEMEGTHCMCVEFGFWSVPQGTLL